MISVRICAYECVCEQTCNMQYCNYGFSLLGLLLQMALDKDKPDEIVRRDIETCNMRYYQHA